MRDVVADDEIRVDLFDELLPAREEIRLLLEFDDLGTDNVGAGVESEDVADEGLGLTCGHSMHVVSAGPPVSLRHPSYPTRRGQKGLTLPRDHTSDLNDGVLVRLWEDTLPARALNVEREDPQRGDVRPVTLWRVRDEGGVAGGQCGVSSERGAGGKRRSER